jgi:DNA repair exonuclease SbcCD ATPase subunit
MILRGLWVENWRCIRSLSLNDLPLGVVVLHGPNRTGKSSLVKALRCCLFDADHNSTREEVASSLPWSGGTPKVVVEFRVGGSDYRITKVFSTKKEGTAKLEKNLAGSWSTIEDAPKEAARRTRELLGSEKSTGGLNQLLWLTQGEVGLPTAGSIDTSLQKRLVDVLGVLITGRDLSFRQELEKRYRNFFTQEQGKYKKDSAVSVWEQRLQERCKLRDDEKDKLRRWEDAIRQLAENEDERPRRFKAAQDAEAELKRLDEEREQCRERVRLFREATQAHQSAGQRVLQAEQALRQFQEARQRGIEQEAKHTAARSAVEAAQTARDRLAQEHVEKQRDVRAARQAEEQHQAGRDRIEDLRKLLTVGEKLARLEEVLNALTVGAKEVRELEQRLQSTPAPDDEELKKLRENRRKAGELRAQLQAAGLTLNITLWQPLTLGLALDGQSTQPVELPAEQPQRWQLRQRVRIDLADLGTLEVARGQANLDLERAAGELSKLEQQFADSIRSFQEDPASDTCLDRLSDRRSQCRAWQQRLDALRAELRKKAPQGRGVLAAEQVPLESQRQAILARRPELAGKSITAGDIDEEARRFESQAETLKQQRTALEQAEKRTLQERQRADERWQQGKEALSAVTAAMQAHRDELARLGDEATVQATLAAAKQAQSDSERHLANSRLSDAEQQIDQRCAEAKSAYQERQKRLRELEDKLTELRGFLLGNEGLHNRLTDAEARVREAEQAWQREKLEADAHKRLRDLFEECRETQVQQVMGPIAGRVLEWSKRIGLEEYHEVRFGDKFLPEGIVLQNGTAGSSVALDVESYGTGEQLSLLVRLALGGVLARDEPVTAIFDDPLAHADPGKHRKILDVIRLAAEGNTAWNPPAGPMQIVVLTCHPDRFDYLLGAKHIDLAQLIVR